MIDDCYLYANRKQKKYFQAYGNNKASWCYFPYNAHLFTNKEMADLYANKTNGEVVSVEIVIRKVDDPWAKRTDT